MIDFARVTSSPRVQLSEDLKAVEAKHQKTSSAVGELTDALAALSDEMEELKEKMDSKGETVSVLLMQIDSKTDTAKRHMLRRRTRTLWGTHTRSSRVFSAQAPSHKTFARFLAEGSTRRNTRTHHQKRATYSSAC